MNDKDLSKPIAWTDKDEISDEYGYLFPMADEVNASPSRVIYIYEPEYIQSLLNRIAELEALVTDYATKFQTAQDNAKKLGMVKNARIAELESIVNTPVKLPSKFDLKMGGDKATRTAFKWHNDAIDECAKAVQAHGLVVQGDTTP
ncbi:hypothetical protein [Raoultella sp. C349492]|uniref:hypothetical protein n=1 Tax=Raoultella sp. C349492 TaxID=2970253 RepID=UPI0035C6D152